MKSQVNQIPLFASVPVSLVFGLFSFHIAPAGVWVGNGSMTTARYGHTATLLQNGKVLATGGGYNAGFFKSAELYNPSTRTWTTTLSMVANRAFHTATLLPSGKVLVAGGLSSAGIYNTANNRAELYDPVLGRWNSTGPLTTARYSHTATLLPNGKVLVVGGNKDLGYDSSAELYNPTTGSWTSAGVMPAARSQHTATLLPDGRVLVAGGVGLSSAVLYDPASGIWTLTGSMTSARRLHTATLLPNGKVLVAGGVNSSSATLSTAETYDPTNGTWTAVGAMAATRCLHTATLLANGKVFVTGGGMAPDGFTDSELYQPGTGMWIAAVPMRTARGEHSATLLSDASVLVAGGRAQIGSSVESISSTQLYTKDPATVILGNLVQTYDGSTKRVAVTTAPPDLTVNVTYNGSVGAPFNAGTYTVIGIINDPDYQGGVTNELVISKAEGTVTLDNLVQTYDGTAKSISFITTPQGLTVDVTYNGSRVAPTNPGSYTVVGTIADLNYFGSTTNLLLVGIWPAIQSQPANCTNNLGTTATFNVVADGTPPLSFQWRKNGINFSDVNCHILTLTNVQEGDEGLYSVVISNAFGGVISADARLTVNQPPVADATATLPWTIAVNGSNATVVLDGSRSHDPDGDLLQYAWSYPNSTSVPTTGAMAVVLLPVGTNPITLTVSDGMTTDSQTISVQVLTPDQAISQLIVAANDATAKKSLLATLRGALAAIDRSNPSASVNQLQAFQYQVNTQLEPVDPETAQALINQAQSIIDAITGGSATLGKIHITRKLNGESHLNFSGVPGRRYVIEASYDLINWEIIGVANNRTNANFIFDDNISPSTPARFYRVAVPDPASTATP